MSRAVLQTQQALAVSLALPHWVSLVVYQSWSRPRRNRRWEARIRPAQSLPAPNSRPRLPHPGKTRRFSA